MISAGDLVARRAVASTPPAQNVGISASAATISSSFLTCGSCDSVFLVREVFDLAGAFTFTGAFCCRVPLDIVDAVVITESPSSATTSSSDASDGASEASVTFDCVDKREA